MAKKKVVPVDEVSEFGFMVSIKEDIATLKADQDHLPTKDDLNDFEKRYIKFESSMKTSLVCMGIAWTVLTTIIGFWLSGAFSS